MESIMFLLYVIAYVVLLCWSVTIIFRNRSFNSGDIIIFVLLAFIFENIILFIGDKIGKGDLLKNLNLVRYYLHSIITPLLIFFALSIGKYVAFMKRNWERAMMVGISLYFLLMSIDIFTELVGIQLEPKWEGNILLYESSKSQNFPWMVSIVTFFLLVASIILWIKKRWKWLFVGIIIMVLGVFLTEQSVIANGFELILMLSIVRTKSFIDLKQS